MALAAQIFVTLLENTTFLLFWGKLGPTVGKSLN